MNRLFRILSMAMLPVVVMQVPVYAQEINLSSLSAGGGGKAPITTYMNPSLMI